MAQMKPLNLLGQVSGKLTIVEKTERRSKSGDIYWKASCECGGFAEVVGSNWKRGAHRSCGCEQRALISLAKAEKKPKQCSVPGCDGAVHYTGLCKKHYIRKVKFGDVDYVTPEETRRASNRAAQLARVESVKDTTYRKRFGRHEHRVVAEQKIGRPLRSDEHVHHIDGNKHNNHPDNLEVMTRSEHLRLHALERHHAA